MNEPGCQIYIYLAPGDCKKNWNSSWNDDNGQYDMQKRIDSDSRIKAIEDRLKEAKKREEKEKK